MVEHLEKLLDYQFKDETLLQHALTHRSYGSRNNERLEFLGDSVLGMVIADELFKRYPDAQEGELSRRRAAIVRGTTLADIAREIGIGDHLRLGPGELKSGGYRRDSILADAIEAIIAAVYIESGIDAARLVVAKLFNEKMADNRVVTNLKDPKTTLQEYLQSRKIELPLYELITVSGQSHDQEFYVECKVASLGLITNGRGSSRKAAEQQAAERALQEI